MGHRHSQVTVLGIVTLVLVAGCLAFMLSQCGTAKALNDSFCSEPCHEVVTTELRSAAYAARCPSITPHQGEAVNQ